MGVQQRHGEAEIGPGEDAPHLRLHAEGLLQPAQRARRLKPGQAERRGLFDRLARVTPSALPFRGGGRDALATLYRRHEPALRGFLGRFGGADEARIDDWMHDTFLIAQAHAGRFRGSSALPWLLALAARRVRDSRRQERRRAARERAAAAERSERASRSGRDAPGTDLDDLVASLDERDRVVVELKYVQGLTHAAVAEVLGVSVRTAKTWASRALERLRERLGGDDAEGAR